MAFWKILTFKIVLQQQNSPTTQNKRTSSLIKRKGPGYYSLVLFFCLIPFHFIVSSYFYYYKELFAFLFIIYSFIISQKKSNYKPLSREFHYLIIFFIYVLLSIYFDPHISLYRFQDLSKLSESLQNVSPTIYLLRNIFIYLPMVVFIYLRELSRNEIDRLLKIIALAAPFSILIFLSHFEITISVSSLLFRGGTGTQYNSYVPYLTFPFIVSMYLFFSSKSRLAKFLFFINSIIIMGYIALTTSRQSFHFCTLSILVFFFASRKISMKNLIIIIVFLSVGYLVLLKIIEDKSTNEKFYARYTSVIGFTTSETRWQTALDGLTRLHDIQYLFGAGLTSVMVSGPHNDYIRWLQRIGILGAFLAFLPFFYAAKGAFSNVQKNNNYFSIFILLGLIFTLYHSLFGYPREDVYQAPFVWLGLSLWIVSKNYLPRKILNNSR